MDRISYFELEKKRILIEEFKKKYNLSLEELLKKIEYLEGGKNGH